MGSAARTPVVGVTVLAAVVLAGAVGAAPARQREPSDTDVTPMAAIAPAPVDPDDPAGLSVIAVARPPRTFRVAAAAAVSAPPPPIVVSSPGAMRIPAMTLQAYRNAERMMAAAYPGCGVSWNLLAGIGRIESMHANGGRTDAAGNPVPPIYGPALDGTLPGNEVIVQSRTANRIEYMRAVGPMQFLPTTWSRYASDGNGDGQANPQNVFDAALGAARYLCSGNLNLRDQSQVLTAILRYNNSMPYARNVLGWAAAYATGVAPIDLPPITGPPPPVGDAHLEPGHGRPLPDGVSTADPLLQSPLAQLVSGASQSQYPIPPALSADPATVAGSQPLQAPTCVLFCPAAQVPPPAPAPLGVPPVPAPLGVPPVPAPLGMPPAPAAEAPPAPAAANPVPASNPAPGEPVTPPAAPGGPPPPTQGPLPGPAAVS
ncbi:lytic transglycosylase domain-containing protein [Mycobacterium sp. MYCO198283]|uniref:lytic transglycosylase domain-containing protein n=1 Tax=Mycobacterium sp. MYCO198283 TaxID=2883505 RepID=UPI0035AB98A0